MIKLVEILIILLVITSLIGLTIFIIGTTLDMVIEIIDGCKERIKKKNREGK